jgi:hypothetical protein
VAELILGELLPHVARFYDGWLTDELKADQQPR